MEKSSTAVILSGALIKDESGKWRTTTFDDRGDKFGAVGDRLRILAGAYLYKKNPDLRFIIMGGRGQLSQTPTAPPLSLAMKRELRDLGVPPKRITTEQNSGTTFDSLMVLQKIIAKKKLKKIMIISNRYHLPRIKTMIKNITILRSAFRWQKVKLISAEKVLIDVEPKLWKEKLKTVYQGAKMKKRIALEKKGIADFKAGKYIFMRY